MKITTKVNLLRLGCEGMFQLRLQGRSAAAEALYELHEEIAEYLKANLPEHNQIWANSTIIEIKDIIEALFKDPNSPRRADLQEYLGKLSSAAFMMPEDKQEV